ncbi:MAG: ABC transporter permease, partial [Candidatus Obscuribacterales bacterium]|nr:ABC transporter permease [Candidatus Obscuribacterales bacterium]
FSEVETLPAASAVQNRTNTESAPLERFGEGSSRSFASQLSALFAQRQLLFMLVARDVSSRYKGSLLGRLWPLVHPLGQLLIYTFVFSIVLKVKFAGHSGPGSFAVYFMAGLIPWSIFSESLSRAATVILENPNMVTKVVFPTEVLPLVNVFSALCTQFLASVVLFVSASIYLGTVHGTVLLAPLLVLPLICLSAGLSWFLASLGVFLRDTRHLVSLALQAGMYATPILYPSDSLPAEYRWVALINPLSGIVDDFRRVLLDGTLPDFPRFAAYTSFSLLVCFAGLYFFLKTKKSFADVM